MFVPRQNRTMFSAGLATLALIYHVTVHDLRKSNRSAVFALLSEAIRSIVMIAGFMLMFWVMGVRGSPLRGDYTVFLMSGIFLYFAHVGAVGAVASAGSSVGHMYKHEPMNTAVVITGAALAALYRSVFSGTVVLGLYYLYQPFVIENWIGCLSMLLLAWATGCSVGLIFLSIRPWSPLAANVASQVYQRGNMIASGKMFVANSLPAHLVALFDWNPLFHIIDQSRGFAFINYSPHRSSISYAAYCGIACLMVGLMLEFVTRRSESVSWNQGR